MPQLNLYFNVITCHSPKSESLTSKPKVKKLKTFLQQLLTISRHRLRDVYFHFLKVEKRECTVQERKVMAKQHCK